MGLFDNGKNKVENMYTSMNLSSLISTEEKQLNSLYNQIGKLYVQLHETDYEQDFDALMKSVLKSNNKLKEYREQLSTINGTVQCSCGATIPKGALFCTKCGKKVEQTPPQVDTSNMLKCDKCGNYVQKGMKFCTRCGNALSVPAPAPESSFCTNCGTKLEPGAEFCTECGTKQ